VKKSILIFLFLLVTAWVFGQKKSKVTLVSSTTLESNKGANGKNIVKVHQGVFRQDYSILRSDSAYFYPDLNAVDAFGHVNINQGDTLNIYSDKLNYNGNTKVAILTDNVKMIDKDATLTTNYLTYNTATRIATYTGGGKLVNKDNTLVSKNGYYFAFSRDSYFRYNVICTTTDAVIKTDTLRYNSGTRITYFYGPTNILGTKDKDTLYTENGTYNTITEQAFFGKKNRYAQGTKTLKGDSLFYDRLKGYGRAVKHVTFNDNEQKTTIKGELGEYYKPDDRAVVTQNAYVVFVTEDKDTTKTDSVSKKLSIIKPDSLAKKLPGKTDTLSKKLLAQSKANAVTKKAPDQTATVKNKGTIAKPESTTKGKVDTVAKKIPDQATIVKNKGTVTKPESITKGKVDTVIKNKPIAIKPPEPIKRDSLFMGADTLETQILTYKDLKILKQQRYDANNRDTSIKVVKTVLLTKPPKVLTAQVPKISSIPLLFHPDIFGKPAPKPVAAPKKPLKPIDPKKLKQDSINNKRKLDSLTLIADHGLVDTSRIRIISGHHHAKIFKSDLQAKADSMFYSYSDSTIRMYVRPIIWTQGSQLSGDTINLQMKNRKLDNLDMYPAAFIVNIEKRDSLHFNQMGGRTMHGTFKDDRLSSMLVTGNGETIAYNRDSATNKVTDIHRSVSGRILARFKNGEISKGGFYSKDEGHILPIAKVKEEDRVLKNFIWKPKERPKSKEDVIASYKPPVAVKAADVKSGPPKGTMPIKSPGKKSVVKKTTGKAATKPTTQSPVIKTGKDTTINVKPDTSKKPAGNTTTKPVISPPAIKTGKDTTINIKPDTSKKPKLK